MRKKIYKYFVILIFCFSIGEAGASQTPIVVLGDSLAAGYKLPSDKGFVHVLQQKLKEKKYEVKLIDAAVPGDTTKGGLARLEWATPENTKGVILELGANDALRGVPPEKTKKNLEEIIQKLKKRNIIILLAGMRAPPNLGEQYEQKFNAIYNELAQKYKTILFPFFLKDVAARKELNLQDAIHPNEKGVEIIVENILPFVETMISEIKK